MHKISWICTKPPIIRPISPFAPTPHNLARRSKCIYLIGRLSGTFRMMDHWVHKATLYQMHIHTTTFLFPGFKSQCCDLLPPQFNILIVISEHENTWQFHGVPFLDKDLANLSSCVCATDLSGFWLLSPEYYTNYIWLRGSEYHPSSEYYRSSEYYPSSEYYRSSTQILSPASVSSPDIPITLTIGNTSLQTKYPDWCKTHLMMILK